MRSSNSMLLILFRIWSILAVAQSSATSQPIPASQSPSIFFFQTTHDFNKIGTSTRNTCNFIFINRGSNILKINKIKSTCGCTVPELTKKEYQPGEGGEIKVAYSAPSKTGKTSKSIYVSTNDPNNKNIKLTIKADVVNLIEVNPEKLHLVLNKENAGTPDITLKSINDEPFSVNNIISTGNGCIAIDFDSSISSNEFVLKTKIDIEKLRLNPKG